MYVFNPQASQSPGSQAAVYGGHCMFVTRIMDDPRVAKIDEFVSDEEADYLVELAHQTGLKPSHVVCASVPTPCKCLSKDLWAYIVCGRSAVGGCFLHHQVAGGHSV